MRQVHINIDEFVGVYLVNGFIQMLSSDWRTWMELIIGTVYLIHTISLRETLLVHHGVTCEALSHGVTCEALSGPLGYTLSPYCHEGGGTRGQHRRGYKERERER